MRISVNPTRMELLKLKRRRDLAYYGHKLLKEKRDSLMKDFLKIIRDVRQLRERIEKEMREAMQSYVLATMETRPGILEEAFVTSQREILVDMTTKNVMNVTIPYFNFQSKGETFCSFCYSLAFSSSDLDNFVRTLTNLLNDILRLAELENAIYLLSLEIEKTRRRVNALEHVFIPAMEETIKYISRKLEEQERSTIISLMKIKERIQ